MDDIAGTETPYSGKRKSILREKKIYIAEPEKPHYGNRRTAVWENKKQGNHFP